jgi:methyl-accepting chemotaxis protein
MNWETLFPREPSKWVWPVKDLTDLTDYWIVGTVAIAILASLWATFRTFQAVWRTTKYDRSFKAFKTLEHLMTGRAQWVANRSLPLAAGFDELLIEVPRRENPLERDLRRCGDASEVFNTSTLAHGLVGSRLLLAIPAILTGLGVLGTFVGLQVGIGALNIDASQIATLDKSIAPIIKGCSTAFATSVWGVVCSLLFTVLEKFLEWLAIGRIKALQSKLNWLVPRYKPEDSMVSLQASALESESQIKGLAIAIGDEMQKAMNRLGSSITDAVRETLGGQAQSLGDGAAKLMSQALTNELCKIQQIVNGVDDTVKSSRQAMSQAVERLTAHESVVKAIEKGAEELKAAAIELNSMKEAFTLSAQKNSDAAWAQEKAANVNESVASKLQIIGDKLPDVQESISNGASVIASLGQPLLDLKDILGKTPEVFGQQAEKQSQREEKRSFMLLQQTESLAATVATAADKFAQIEGLSKSLAESTHNLERAGGALGILAEGIEKASLLHQNAAQASERAAQASNQAAERLNPVSESITKLSGTLADAGGKIREGADAAKLVYGQLLEHQKEWFRGIEAGLRAMRDRVQEILDQFGDSVDGKTREHMELWTKAVNENVSKFAVQVQTLEGAINDLTAEMNH